MLRQNRTTRHGGAILEMTAAGPRLTVIYPRQRMALVKGSPKMAPSDVLQSMVIGGGAWKRAEPTDNHVVSPFENLCIAFRLARLDRSGR